MKQAKGAIFPGPVQVFSRIIRLFQGSILYDHLLATHLISSLIRWGVGYLLAIVAGLLSGLFLGTSKIIYRVGMPIIYVLQLIPGLAWIPISLLLFGIGNVSTIFMIFIMGFTPIVINTSGSIRSAPSIHINAAKMMGAGRTTLLLKVLIPFASLQIINGLRIGLANAWRVLIAAEMIVGVGVGLGYIIIQSRWSLDFEAAFVSIVLIIIIGLIIEKAIFGYLERRISYKLGIESVEHVGP